MAETVQSIRTNLAAINLVAKARPAGNDPQSIAAANVADEAAPLIHEEHLMNQVMRESDFWLIACGNACLQLSWDKDVRFNRVFIPHEKCVNCGAELPPDAIVNAGNVCPQCGGGALIKAIGPDGQPLGQWAAFGKGKTTALSPFEYAFPPNVTRFDELPYIIRLRWRDKHYFEANHPEMVGRLQWEKSPSDRSLQIFKSLALTNDVGTGSQFAYLGAAGAHTVEGVTEYELWIKPTKEFPQGFVMRVAGDTSPVIIHAEDEGIPGPIPYKDVDGNPLFPFCHAQYEHMGGRLYGRSALSPLIQKQDQINQLDSLIQLIVQRSANPTWIIPENAGIENLTGEPGLIVKWNVLASQGQGKPERVDGGNIQQSLFQLREQYIRDIEELSGAFDIIKGQKPSGIEAFSALQLLVERSQSRFTSVFQSRGEMYRSWYSLALELERQFGPQQRVWSVFGQNRGYTFHQFENAQLQGQVTIQIEDGSNMPKTALGKRAAIEQANQLQLLNPADPEQRYALLESFGLSDLAPSLDMHVQAALQLQDAFETWAIQPDGPCPLVIKPWFDLQIHLSERIKWLNTDRMREMLKTNPGLEPIVTAHLQQLQMLLQPPPMPGQGPGGPGSAEGKAGPGGSPQGGPPSGGSAPGGGQAMRNSNAHGNAQPRQPSGNAQHGPNQGPR
jgi:DNA-directed RNA polymerase subunit RPC12/RpoP